MNTSRRLFEMRGLCRAVQIVALVAGPLAIILQLSEAISVGQMLVLGVAAACLFWIARIAEGYAAR